MALNITDIDYDNILINFKNYLKSQDTFKDYDFDGSALSELLKILSYNTFYNSFYTNHIANEMFLDSASERSSVVSRAKGLGYIPSSQTSSFVYVDITAHVEKIEGDTTPTSESFITLNKNTILTSSINDIDYSFITTSVNNLYYIGDGGTYWIYEQNNVKLTEGKIIRSVFEVTNEYNKFELDNSGIDISSMIVSVYDNVYSASSVTYSKSTSIIDAIDGNSMVYWAFEGFDGKYYIEFGNDRIGKKLSIGNYITVDYIVNNGLDGNGASIFEVGNYSYSNTSIVKKDLFATSSDFTTLIVSNTSSEFSSESFVRGETSNNTAYVYDFDSLDNILRVYASANSFIPNEIIHEEYTIGANIIIGSSAEIDSIKTNFSISTGGSDLEDINSIKFNAPKLYASQNRLVTKSDYESIIMYEYPFVKSVSCWGGEEEDPQQLGEVFVSINPKSRTALDIWEKNWILENIIEDRKVVSTNVHIIDPDYIYIYPTILIKYDADVIASVTRENIIADAKDAIQWICTAKCDNYNSRFYYTPFCSTIDDSNEFILGNDTLIQLLKEFTPLLNVPYTAVNQATFKFSNEIVEDSLTSTRFTCNVASVDVPNCTFSANTISNVILQVANTTDVIIENAGTIDYSEGIIYVSNVTIASTDLYNTANNNLINIIAEPSEKDLTSNKNQILKIYSNITLSATPIRSRYKPICLSF